MARQQESPTELSHGTGFKRALSEVGDVQSEFSPHYKTAKIDAMAVSMFYLLVCIKPARKSYSWFVQSINVLKKKITAKFPCLYTISSVDINNA